MTGSISASGTGASCDDGTASARRSSKTRRSRNQSRGGKLNARLSTRRQLSGFINRPIGFLFAFFAEQQLGVEAALASAARAAALNSGKQQQFVRHISASRHPQPWPRQGNDASPSGRLNCGIGRPTAPAQKTNNKTKVNIRRAITVGEYTTRLSIAATPFVTPRRFTSPAAHRRSYSEPTSSSTSRTIISASSFASTPDVADSPGLWLLGFDAPLSNVPVTIKRVPSGRSMGSLRT